MIPVSRRQQKSRLAAPAAFGEFFDYLDVQRFPSSTSGFGNVKK